MAGLYSTAEKYKSSTSPKKEQQPKPWQVSGGGGGGGINDAEAELRVSGPVSIVQSNDTSPGHPLRPPAKAKEGEDPAEEVTDEVRALLRQLENKLYERNLSAKDAFLKLDTDRSGDLCPLAGNPIIIIDDTVD